MGGSSLKKRSAVFLDRDGVINLNVMNPQTGLWESPSRVEDFEILPTTLAALRRLRDAGFLLFVVSNQPNYAKAKATLATLESIHHRLLDVLSQAQVDFAAFYYCLHHPQGVVPEYTSICHCRKPSPFFLFQARDEFCLDLECSWMVGDRETDIECGEAAGAHTIRVFDREEGALAVGKETKAEFQAIDLEAATKIILGS